MHRLSRNLKQLLTLMVAVCFLGAIPAAAQVSVSLPDGAGAAGTSGTIPVTVGDLTGEGVLSFDFTITFDESVVDITGFSADGTISEGMSISADTTGNSIRVVAAGAEELTGSGTLINLNADFGAEGNSALTFTDFVFNEGTPAADLSDGAIEIPEVALSLPHTTGAVGADVTIPVSTTDLTGGGVLAYDITISFDEEIVDISGIDATGTISDGMSINTDTAGNAIRIVAASGSELSGTGTLINLTGTVISEGMSVLDFTSVTLNEGTPHGAGVDGSITVGAEGVPTFEAALPDTTISEGQTLAFTYVATDPEGAALTYSITEGPAGATINAVTGELQWTPGLDDAGSHIITVEADNGTQAVTTTATVTVTDVEAEFQANLSGINEVPPVLSSGAGIANIDIDGNNVTVTGSFSNLVSDVNTAIRGGAHIHVGGVGTNGPIVIELQPTFATDERSGTFEADSNTVDVTTLTFPEGIDADSVLSALQNGNAYVNVHTDAHGSGEIRGQILRAGNSPPDASQITSPVDGSSYDVEGDPEDLLFTIATSVSADPDGDEVLFLLQVSSEPNFPLAGTEYITFGETPSLDVTVHDGARIFDEASGAEPGEIPIGSSEDIYMRTIATDGSQWTVGPTVQISLTRGLVTDTEPGLELPGVFSLKGNYPNPFNPSTTVRFDLPAAANVSVEVYDMLGRRVMTVQATSVQAGAERSVEIDAAALTSGTYVYRVIAETTSDTMVKSGKMTLVK